MPDSTPKSCIEVTVYLSPAEYKRFSKGRALTRDGTMSNAIRKALGLQARPLNFIGSRKYTEVQWNAINGEYEYKSK